MAFSYGVQCINASKIVYQELLFDEICGPTYVQTLYSDCSSCLLRECQCRLKMISLKAHRGLKNKSFMLVHSL
jgi:hypothetical protein